MSVKFSDIIEKYNGEGDFLEWITKLELVASLQKVHDLAKFIPLFLTGGAFSVYIGLDEEVRSNYQAVKSTLIGIFSDDKFTVYETLILRKLKVSESVDVYLADIKRMVQLIDGLASDDFVKTAFVCGLPSDVKSQLRAACSLTEMSLDMIVQRTRNLMKSGSANSEMCCVSGRNERETSTMKKSPVRKKYNMLSLRHRKPHQEILS